MSKSKLDVNNKVLYGQTYPVNNDRLSFDSRSLRWKIWLES